MVIPLIGQPPILLLLRRVAPTITMAAIAATIIGPGESFDPFSGTLVPIAEPDRSPWPTAFFATTL